MQLRVDAIARAEHKESRAESSAVQCSAVLLLLLLLLSCDRRS